MNLAIKLCNKLALNTQERCGRFLASQARKMGALSQGAKKETINKAALGISGLAFNCTLRPRMHPMRLNPADRTEGRRWKPPAWMLTPSPTLTPRQPAPDASSAF